MYRNNSRNSLIACILTLSCFFMLMPSLGSAQTDKVKTSMAALKAETGKLGAPSEVMTSSSASISGEFRREQETRFASIAK